MSLSNNLIAALIKNTLPFALYLMSLNIIIYWSSFATNSLTILFRLINIFSDSVNIPFWHSKSVNVRLSYRFMASLFFGCCYPCFILLLSSIFFMFQYVFVGRYHKRLDLLTRKKLLSIYVDNMNLIYWSFCLSSRRGGVGKRRWWGGTLFYTSGNITLLKYMKIWYNIQVIIYRFIKAVKISLKMFVCPIPSISTRGGHWAVYYTSTQSFIKKHFLIRWLKNFDDFYLILNGWFIKLSV